MSRPAFTPLSKLPNFDPRRVPVIGMGEGLAPVPRAALSEAALRQRFASPPAWQPEVVLEQRFSDRAMAHAAVLVPIVMREHPTVLLTERTAHLSTHSGQIAFPGGKVDVDDESPQATALREANEEVGLEPHRVELIGQLPIYTTGSAFIITPVVGLVDPAYSLTPNAFEVADAFEVPLEFLMNPNHHRRHRLEFEGASREWFSMPYQDQQTERFIWGATAGMLRNFYRFLSA